MRCDQCIHWVEDPEVGWEAIRTGFRKCSAVSERWRITDEASAKLNWDGGDEGHEAFINVRMNALRNARAYVQDGSEYKAELVTAPDYFCALFTSK